MSRPTVAIGNPADMASTAFPSAPAPAIRGETGKGLTLIFAQVLPVMAIVSLFPAIPRLFAHFGPHPHAGLLVPMIVTIPSLCVAIFAPLAGWAADRFGRRPCFVGAMALYVLTGLAPLVLDNLYLIVLSRAVLGMAEAAIITISSALIGDYFGERRYRWVTWVGVATSIAGTLLIAAGGALADLSWRGPFAIYALAVPAFLLALVFIEEPARQTADQSRPRLGFPWRAASIIGAITIVTSVLYYVEPLHVATVLTDKGAGSATRVGLIQSVTSIAYILGAFLYRRMHARSIGQLLGLAGFLIGAGVVVIALSPTWHGVAVGAAIQQLGGGMVIPSLLAWGQAILPIEQRGRGMGIWATAFFAGLFICPPLVGAAASLLGGLQPSLLLFGALTLALAFVPPLLFGRAKRADA